MRTLTDRLEALWGTITQPENLTALMEDFTVWGLVVPVVLYLFSWIFKEAKSQKACLVLIALAAVAPFFVPDRDATPLPGGAPWAYVSLAALAGLTVFLGKGGKAGLWLTILSLLGSLSVAALTLSITLEKPFDLPGPPDVPEVPEIPEIPDFPGTSETTEDLGYPAEGEFPEPE